MEHNEITVRVDVKMDLKERRSEFAVYRVRPCMQGDDAPNKR